MWRLVHGYECKIKMYSGCIIETVKRENLPAYKLDSLSSTFCKKSPTHTQFHTDSQQCQWSNHLIRVLEGNDMEGGKHKGLGRGVSMA